MRVVRDPPAARLAVMVPDRRVFLGWDRPAIDAAAEWLLARGDPGGEGTLVALPGAQAGRLLDERLARAVTGGAFGDRELPQTVTVGHLPDRLLQLDAPAASRLTRTRAWERALRALSTSRLERLVAFPPGPDDHREWRRLAIEVRTVFGQLAAERCAFADVLTGPLAEGMPGERGRWEAMAAAQVSYEQVLASAGLCDPHLGRLAAIEAGAGAAGGPAVVLLGVVEMGGLHRRLLETRDDVTALVIAPEELRTSFDELGCVETDAWLERGWSLPTERWQVAEGPGGQARLALDAIARWGGRFAPESITIGVPDEEVVPFLEGRLAEQGIFARHVAGTPSRRTSPARLLEATAAFLAGGRFEDLASLLRHPDLEQRLARGLEGALDSTTLSEVLDRYHCEHLPGALSGEWLRCTERGSAGVSEVLESVSRNLDAMLGPLTGPERPLAAWAPAVRALLIEVYGERTLDPGEEAARRLGAALAALARALDEAQGVPGAADADLPAAEALAMVLEEAGGDPIAARIPGAEEASIELAGWLELALDEAPALVLTGFNEGKLPAAVTGDSWLPDGLRGELGLPDDARRLARDRYLLECIVHSREEAVFVGGRRSADGEALLPSRLALYGSGEEMVSRLCHGLSAIQEPRPEVALGGPARGLHPIAGVVAPTRWSASAFGGYLSSPYAFALGRAHLQTLDDRAREMDPLQFGIVVHEVLQRFGAGDAADSSDARAVHASCEAELERVCHQRFGARPQAAVQLQRRQLSWRLGLFAEVQAQRAAAGWRIECTEWSPQGVTLDVDGEAVELVGRIDRIDRHRDGRWALLDYKTSEGSLDPTTAHRSRSGEWRSLQLPLYAFMARELIGTGECDLGFFQVGANAERVLVRTVQGWDESALAEALERAREIVREVRATLAAGESFEPGAPYLGDPIMAAVFGQGLLGDGAEDGGEGGRT